MPGDVKINNLSCTVIEGQDHLNAHVNYQVAVGFYKRVHFICIVVPIWTCIDLHFDHVPVAHIYYWLQ